MTLIDATCPACAHHVAVPFLASAPQPLATLGWPATPADAQAMKRLPNDFVQCLACTHVFNPCFAYAEVPYSDQPNNMFNAGSGWSTFLGGLRDRLLADLSDDPVVAEIGYGDGSFLHGLAQAAGRGRFVGFDPHGAHDVPGVETRASLFEPTEHLNELVPELIFARHVLEHLTSAVGLLQRLGAAAALSGRPAPRGYFEVPCVDKAIAARRTVDFYYEHASQFTTRSFRTMLERAGFEIVLLGHAYDQEVVFAHVRLTSPGAQTARDADAFHAAAARSLPAVKAQLAALAATSDRVAIWGGTGKSAAFLNRYGLDAERFPLVVDSDPHKLGTCVPGTGQVIVSPDVLRDAPADVIILPPQWRARDILQEMGRRGLSAGRVLIEHDGALVDFRTGDHPYARD